MELREFVAMAITDITNGLADAQEAIKDVGGTINPIGIKAPGVYVGDSDSENEVQVQRIEFDVAVTTTQDETTKGGIGVMGVVSFGASKSDNISASHVTNIKFSVPIVFPAYLPNVYANPQNKITQQRKDAALSALH